MRTNGSREPTQALVEQTIAGDQEAFAELVHRYRDAASAVAYSHFGGFDDVQDAVQEAFVQAYCRLRQLREPAKFGPWLRTITSNACAMALRKRERSNVSLDDIPERPATEGDPQKIAARVVVRDALAKLSEGTRLAVTLSYINGYSHAEIAEFLDIPVNTVRTRLQHAKRKLREEMIGMVSDVLHEDKPGEELVRKILDNEMLVDKAMMVGANEEAMQHCDDALAAWRDLRSSRTPDQLRELVLRTVESEGDFQGDKARALHNLKTWTLEQIQVREEAEWLLRKGEVLLRLEDVGGAKKLFEQAMELVRGINDQEALALVIGRLARNYHGARQSQLAREYLPQVVEAAREAGNASEEATNLWALGNTYLEDVQFAHARPLYERARELFGEASQPEMAAMVQALLDLIQEVGEQRWGSLLQGIAVGQQLRKTGDVIEITDRGGGWLSKPGEHVLGPEIGVLFRTVLGKIIDSSLAVGESWSGLGNYVTEAAVKATTTIVSRSESVDTPAGSFQDCMLLETVTVENKLPDNMSEELKRRIRDHVCGWQRSWFAPGVGLVRFVSETRAGGETVVNLAEYEIVEPSADYLPLAVGNSWAYGWADAPAGLVAKERYRVAANDGEHWYLEDYRYVLRESKAALDPGG